MNPDQSTATLDESIKQVMQTLPPPIRNYLGQGKYSVVAQRLVVTYGLHIDQGTILEREIMLLLMGIENPDEFVQALAQEAKLDQETINGIAQDVNAQIFVPLREEMQKAATAPQSPPTPMQPPARPVVLPPHYAPPRPVQAASIVKRVMPAPPPAPRMNIPPARPPISVPVPPPPPPASRAMPRPTEMPPFSFSSVIEANPSLPQRQQQEYISKVPKYVPPPKQPTPAALKVAPAPVMQKPAQPMNINRMLEDHEEPSITLGAVPRSVAPIESKPPMRIFRRQPVNPDTGLPPPNLPGTIPVASAIPNIIRRPALDDTPPPPVPLTPKPPVRYSADPYHEPLDDKQG